MCSWDTTGKLGIGVVQAEEEGNREWAQGRYFREQSEKSSLVASLPRLDVTVATTRWTNNIHWPMDENLNPRQVSYPANPNQPQ